MDTTDGGVIAFLSKDTSYFEDICRAPASVVSINEPSIIVVAPQLTHSITSTVNHFLK